jgi:hypothetical protein
MSEKGRHGRKRKVARHNKLVWLFCGVVLFAGSTTAGIYLVTKWNEPKVAGLPSAVPWSEIVPTFEDIVDAAYGKKYDVKNWEKTPNGKRGSNDKGFTVEIAYGPGQATVVLEGTLEREPDGSIASLRFVDFCVFALPADRDRNRIGDRGAVEIVELRRADVGAQSAFRKTGRSRAPVGKAAAKGKMIEANASYSYDETTKKCVHRMEIKKIAP